jgi:hypothetical protein
MKTPDEIKLVPNRQSYDHKAIRRLKLKLVYPLTLNYLVSPKKRKIIQNLNS